MNQTKEKYKEQEKSSEGPKLSAESHGRGEKPVFQMNAETIDDRKLRTPRSEIYMQLFDAVDILSSTDEEILEKIKENLDEETEKEFLEMSPEDLREEIRLSFVEEFESLQIEISSVLKGVLAKCYLTGCDCHAISSEGKVLEHYHIAGHMPRELQKGRPLLRKYGDDCKCVEVYDDCCRVVMKDSSVITVKDVK